MVKGFRQIASLTALSRVFGLVRDIAYSHFFGANQLLDAWIIAFRIPNLSRRLFGEGAASASLIPVYSEALERDREGAARLANTVVTVLFVVLAGLVLAGEGCIWFYQRFFSRTGETDLILSLSSIMLPYMLMVCTVAILAGLLNVHRHFAAPAAAPIVLNVFIIGTIVSTGWLFRLEVRQQLFCVAGAVLAAGVVQVLVQVGPLRSAGISIRPAWGVQTAAFRKIVVLMVPMILGLTATQINTLADDLIAWWFSGSAEKGSYFILFGREIAYPMWRGSVSHLYYAQRLYQLPLGVLGISLATAIFPVMSADAARRDFGALRRTISRGIRGAVFVAVPATVGLALVARPLISAAFEHGRFTSRDTSMVVWTLCFYALGLCGYFSQQILTRAYYSMQDSRAPMRSAVVAVLANCVLNLILIWFLDRGGLACATAACSYLQVGMLIVGLRRRLGHSVLDGLGLTVLKSVASTAIMGVAGLSAIMLMRGLPSGRSFEMLRVGVVVPVAAGTYILAARLLRTEALSLLSGRTADDEQSD